MPALNAAERISIVKLLCPCDTWLSLLLHEQSNRRKGYQNLCHETQTAVKAIGKPCREKGRQGTRKKKMHETENKKDDKRTFKTQHDTWTITGGSKNQKVWKVNGQRWPTYYILKSLFFLFVLNPLLTLTLIYRTLPANFKTVKPQS